MAFFTYEGEEYQYTILRKRKKNISISVGDNGDVKVSIPYNVPLNYVENLVSDKGSWIVSKVEERKNTGLEKDYLNKDSSYVLIQGKKHRVKVNEISGASHCEKIGDEFIVNINQTTKRNKNDEVKFILTGYLMNLAKDELYKRTVYFSELTGFGPQKIVIKDVKSIWGSCTSKNIINYNYRIIMAPPEILDYIVVHELCHIKHKNHSKEYWKCVENIIPDWKEKRKWLKENGAQLKI